MATTMHNAQALLEKIQSLPTDRIAEKEPLDFPVDDLGPWPDDLSLRREDMYGDDGR